MGFYAFCFGKSVKMFKSICCFPYPSIGLKSGNTLKLISAFVRALSFSGGEFNSSCISLSLFRVFHNFDHQRSLAG